MSARSVTLNAAQLKQIQVALTAIGRRLAQLGAEGGAANQATVALIGTNLAVIQSWLTNVQKGDFQLSASERGNRTDALPQRGGGLMESQRDVEPCSVGIIRRCTGRIPIQPGRPLGSFLVRQQRRLSSVATKQLCRIYARDAGECSCRQSDRELTTLSFSRILRNETSN